MKKAEAKPDFWPADCKKLERAGYSLQYVRPCKLCKTPLEFWLTPAGKYIPLERQVGGNRIPHHSTCPHAEAFRKKKIEQGELFR